MRILNGSLLLTLVMILQSCSGGGAGGIVAITNPPSSDTLVDVSGQANKGPFSDGARVTARSHTGNTVNNGTTVGMLGEFTVRMRRDVAGEIEISGRFFSENRGVTSSEEITLSAVVMGDPDQKANVNVATHLVHERVLELMESGMAFEEAMSSAHSEMILAMSEVIPVPSNPMRFSDLVVVNAAQMNSNPEGNAWLLACTAVLEQVAIARSEANGTSMELALQDLMDEMAAAFAGNGMIPQAILDEMVSFRGQINPNTVHGHLMNWGEELRDEALMDHFGMSRMEVESLQCAVSGSDIECMPGGGMQGGGNMRRISLQNLVANMNRFLDTDGDGIVNEDDEDDDDDGIPDTEDDTPYGSQASAG